MAMTPEERKARRKELRQNRRANGGNGNGGTVKVTGSLTTLKFDLQEVDNDWSWDVRRFAEERSGAIDALRNVADALASIDEDASKEDVDTMAELVAETNVERLLARLTARVSALQVLQSRKLAITDRIAAIEKVKADHEAEQAEAKLKAEALAIVAAAETPDAEPVPDAVGGFVEVTEQVPAAPAKRKS